MRVMEIPPFPRTIEITDLESLYRTRLNLTLDLRTSAAIPLLCYMGWPNDSAAREAAMEMLARWLDTGQDNDATKHLAKIDEAWGHVADVVHLHYDMSQGGHQKRRGGPSIGKAIYLFSKTAKTRGTSQANAWTSWETYKDAAHLIAAAMLVCWDIDRRLRQESLGLELQQLLPLRVVLMVPEPIIAIGLTYEKYGLAYVPKGGTEPMLNPEMLWRIPADINVAPLAPPIRKIRPEDTVVLNARRAGNRGRAKRHKTTLVSG
jgi:hypothetical protein